MREIVPRRMIPEYSSTLELGRTIFELRTILAFDLAFDLGIILTSGDDL